MVKIISFVFFLSSLGLAQAVVIDEKTGLMWQDNSSSQDVIKNYEDADDYCNALSLDEYDDWRLPSIDELISISDRDKFSPAIKANFYNVKHSFYWSSSTYLGDATTAWGVHFFDGGVLWDSKIYRNSVRCVRDNHKE